MTSEPETDIYAIVLAAGKGTRMKSARAKVLHEVLFSPMACHVMDSLTELRARSIVVTGHQADRVEETLAPYSPTFVRQNEQLGTGHAVLATEEILAAKTGMALILCGDTPLLRPQTLQQMAAAHTRSGNVLTVMTTVLDDPAGYGRIISNDAGEVLRIVEEKDASEGERQLREINSGIYCVNLENLFPALHKIDNNNAQKELYLTDLVEIVTDNGARVGRFICREKNEILGINSRIELEAANVIMRQRVNKEFMLAGVTLVDSASIFIEKTVSIGLDTTIMGSCCLTGKTVIGRECVIGPFCSLHDCNIPPGSTVAPFTSRQRG